MTQPSGMVRITAKQFREQRKLKPSKYRAKRYFTNGIWFDSIAEGRFYEVLKHRQDRGEISEIVLQPEFVLLAQGGGKVGKYRADFKFFDPVMGRERIVDVKGFDTPLSKLKRKHVKEQYGIDVEIVK